MTPLAPCATFTPLYDKVKVKVKSCYGTDPTAPWGLNLREDGKEERQDGKDGIVTCQVGATRRHEDGAKSSWMVVMVMTLTQGSSQQDGMVMAGSDGWMVATTTVHSFGKAKEKVATTAGVAGHKVVSPHVFKVLFGNLSVCALKHTVQRHPEVGAITA